MRTSRITARIALILSTTTLAATMGLTSTGCAVDGTNDGRTTASTQLSHPVDGVTAIRGIYAGTGEVASRLPLLWQSVGSDDDANVAKLNEVIAAVDAKDPEAVAAFGEAVTSGDVVRVRAALTDMTARLRSASASKQPDSNLIVLDVPVLYIWYPLVITIVAFDNRASPVWRSGGLSQDEIAEHIATQLAVTAK